MKIKYWQHFLWWSWSTKIDVEWDSEHIVYNDYMTAYHYFKDSDTYYRAGAIPEWYRAWNDIPEKYLALEGKLNIVSIEHTLEYLKNHMMSKDFLAYCKNELGLGTTDVVIK